MKVLTGSICVTDIDKAHLFTAKNGKKYLNINIVERSKVGNYGETHFITQYVKGAEQNPIIGSAKPFAKKQNGQVAKSDPDDPFA